MHYKTSHSVELYKLALESIDSVEFGYDDPKLDPYVEHEAIHATERTLQNLTGVSA